MTRHGEISVVWNGNLIEITAIGPFNEEGLSHSLSTIKNSILIKNMKNWCKMEIWDDETLGSPICIDLHKAAAQWFINHGCYATAIVTSNSLQEALLNRNAISNLAIFNDTFVAKKWLDEQST